MLKGLYENYLNIDNLSQVLETSEFDTSIKQLSDAKAIYQKIRQGMVSAVYQNWKKDHIIWEQYDNQSGKGLMTSPFTGWSTLVLLILTETY